MSKRMSKGFYVGGYIGGLAAFVILTSAAIFVLAGYVFRHPDNDPPNLLFGLIGLGLLPILVSVIVVCMLVYRMWAAIQDGHVRTTPAKAVGLLFIPFFNLYWMFHVFHGFAYDYNEYIARRQIQVPRVDEQLFRFFPIMFLCSLIPVVGGIALLASVGVLVAVIAKACDAVNALQNSPPQPTLSQPGMQSLSC